MVMMIVMAMVMVMVMVMVVVMVRKAYKSVPMHDYCCKN